MTTKEKLENALNAYNATLNSLAEKYRAAQEREAAAKNLYNEKSEAVRATARNKDRKPGEIESRRAEYKAAFDAYAEALDNSAILSRCMKVCQDSAMKAAAEVVKKEFISNPEKWTKYPIHYKKFEKLFKDTFGDEIAFSNYRSFKIYHKNYDNGHDEENIFFGEHTAILADEIEKLKTYVHAAPIAPEDIETITREAVKDRQKYIEKYEAVYKELEEIRGKYSYISSLYEIFPHVEFMRTVSYPI